MLAESEAKPNEVPPAAPLVLLDGGPSGQDEATGVEPMPGHEERQVRKHWTLEQNRIVAAEVARLMRKQGLRRIPDTDDRVGGRFMNEFLAAAQLLLPRECRRLGTQRTQFKMTFWKMVEDALANRAEPVLLAPAAAPAAVPPSGAALAPETEAAPSAAQVPAPPEGFATPPVADPLASVPDEALIIAAFERVTQILATAKAQAAKLKEVEDMNGLIVAELAQVRSDHGQILKRIAEVDALARQKNAPEKAALPRIAVIGWHRAEFEKLSARVKNIGFSVDLRHFDQHESPRDISADFAVLMQGASHGWRWKVENCIKSRDRVASVPGGASEVIDQLKLWFQP